MLESGEMKSFAFTLFLILALCSVSRSQEAAGSYAGNGTMIGMTNLTELSDCAAASVTGKIKKVKVGSDLAVLEIDANELEEQRVRVPLGRLKSDEKPIFLKQLIKKGYTVRVAGYRCSADCAITAFSIDRIYKIKK